MGTKSRLFNVLGDFVSVGPALTLQESSEVLDMSVTTVARRFGLHPEVRDYNPGGRYRDLRIPRSVIAKFLSETHTKKKKKIAATKTLKRPAPACRPLETIAADLFRLTEDLKLAVAAAYRPMPEIRWHRIPDFPPPATTEAP
jgi:hypothetical protein